MEQFRALSVVSHGRPGTDVQPLLLVAWLIDRGTLTGGPIELAVGLVPLVWPVVSAIVALGAWRASPA